MKWMLFVGSALGHLVASLGLDQLPERAVSSFATPITIVEAPAEPENTVLEPEPPALEPELRSEAPVEPTPVLAPAVPASPSPSPSPLPAPPTPGPPSLDSRPDLGLEFSGTSALASSVGVASGSGRSRSASAVKVLGVQNARPEEKLSGCVEGESPKPKLAYFQKPAYSDAARGAGVTGKVRVSITVGPEGRVEDATVLAGLGYGLDEATLQAVRAASFEAATRCGRKVRSTFTMSVRFAAE